MKIGIILFSKTGNTLSVAKQIKQKLNNHKVNIEIIQVSGQPENGQGHFNLENKPSTTEYDLIIFGSPVNAFSLGVVMADYLKQIETLDNKKAICLVTQFFPFPFLGGNNAIAQMKKIIEQKKGEIVTTGIINWSSKNREKKTAEVIDNICKIVNQL